MKGSIMKAGQYRRGFTLVEILVVIVIIGILSGIILKLHTLVGERAARAQTLARIESRVSLEEIFARFPDYAVDEERTERVQMSNVAGYASVPITYPPRSS